jgi:hypothetical protein
MELGLGLFVIAARQESACLTWGRNVSTRHKSVPLLFWCRESRCASVNISRVFTALTQGRLEYITSCYVIS